MAQPTGKSFADIKFDTANLYREEMYTDLRVGTIRCLVPVKTDGSADPSRPTLFSCQTQVMSQMGTIPIDGPIDAANLSEAVEKFGPSAEAAFQRMIQEAQEYQREESKRIIVPKGPGAGPLPPIGGKGNPGGLII